MVWEPQPHPPALLLCRSRVVVVPPIVPAMDAAERFEILDRYADHVRRFQELASQRGNLLPQGRRTQVSGIERRPEPGRELTQRELEVLGLVAEGLSSREISKRLFLSEETVRTHVRSVLGRLGVWGA